MEKRLLELPDLGFDDGEPSVKIAITTLAFRNGDMISLLKQRGLCIKTEKWDQMREIEGKINEKKTQIFNDLCHPCSIFMTFETEEGVNRCRLYDETVADNLEKFEHLRLWLGKHELDIQEASEPSDIIWENREI